MARVMLVDPMGLVDWLEFLEAQEVITIHDKTAFREYLRNWAHIPSPVRDQVLAFLNRMVKENPELWLVYRTKRRLLGEEVK